MTEEHREEDRADDERRPWSTRCSICRANSRARSRPCAVRDTLDQAMPDLVDPELRKKILDAALDLAEQLATSTNEFLRSIGRSASETLKR